MKIVFNESVTEDQNIYKQAHDFLSTTDTLETFSEAPVVIYQDGKSKAYYIKCNIQAASVHSLLDMDAKLNPSDENSFRANRELMTNKSTYKKMLGDAKSGREFNDIIVEYTTDYLPEKPLKIWGGQHRSKAIQEALEQSGVSKFHGFKIYFNLSKQQRSEIALISNTNINISNELLDRLQEETYVGLSLRDWCHRTGLLPEGEDFPDRKAERINIKLARTFVTNFYKGKDQGQKASELDKDLDNQIYEPYLCKSGSNIETDPEYENVVDKLGDSIWDDPALLEAGEAFAKLHQSQYEAIIDSSKKKQLENRATYRNKALVESVLAAWSFVAGLLQVESERLENHYQVPRTTKKILDPLNSSEMARFKHDTDSPTYRGLGTRSNTKDRQRMAQLFLARSLDKEKIIDKKLMNESVSRVVGLNAIKQSYKSL